MTSELEKKVKDVLRFQEYIEELDSGSKMVWASLDQRQVNVVANEVLALCKGEIIRYLDTTLGYDYSGTRTREIMEL